MFLEGNKKELEIVDEKIKIQKGLIQLKNFKENFENCIRILEQLKYKQFFSLIQLINLIKIMEQQSIFEYLDTLQLQITDPIQKQLEYYHDKKNIITCQKKIQSSQLRSPLINSQQSDKLEIRKTSSLQTIILPEHENSLNINSHKKSIFEKRITFQ